MKKIPFVSKLKGIRSIKQRNTKFNNLTPEEQRKEIAYDGLKLVLSDQVGAAHGDYWSNGLMKISADNPEQFQKKLLTELPEECKVCQRGLMMLAQIRVGNTVDPDDQYRDEGVKSNIKGFDYPHFCWMENEYERDIYKHPYEVRTKEKLANICCNVIANGNFNVNDKTDYLQLWKLSFYFIKQLKN